MNAKVRLSQQVLKYSFALVLLLIGADQVLRTDLLHAWPTYVSPLASSLPISVDLIIRVLGIAEIAVAILMVTKYTKWAAYISAVVLVVTAVDLLTLGFVDVAARDVLLLVSTLVLAWLTDVVQGNTQTV